MIEVACAIDAAARRRDRLQRQHPARMAETANHAPGRSPQASGALRCFFAAWWERVPPQLHGCYRPLQADRCRRFLLHPARGAVVAESRNLPGDRQRPFERSGVMARPRARLTLLSSAPPAHQYYDDTICGGVAERRPPAGCSGVCRRLGVQSATMTNSRLTDARNP